MGEDEVDKEITGGEEGQGRLRSVANVGVVGLVEAVVGVGV